MQPTPTNLLHTIQESEFLWNELKVRLLLLLTFIFINTVIPPYERPLTESQLNDYRNPKCDSYIPSLLLIGICVIVPFVILLLPWLFDNDLLDTIQALLAWSLGLCMSVVMTEAMKVTVGRLRPDFFYRCFPNGMMTESLNCTGMVHEVREGRKSFPSGHSSFSFCSLGFLSLWLCGRTRILFCNGELTQKKLFICTAPLILAALISASRCMDNHHHWSDVVFGAIMGLILTYISYCRYYHFLTCEYSGEPFARTIV